ncbi:Nn.00g009290.m01.CDS01 [Neocucurbitaria sp. VM-36]
MKTTGIVAAAAILLQSQQAQASPISNLVARGKADILKSLLEFFGTFFPEAERAWDIGSHPQMCKVYMETKDGANCKASVTCDDGTKEYNPDGATWNVCYVGGRQYFTDPRIGDFSITFTEKDGEGQGEGLTTPNLQLKYVGDWKEFPVNDLAVEYNKHMDCEENGASPFRDCGDGPYVCHWGDFGNGYISTSRTKKWECGVPKIGKGGGGLNSDAPNNDKGYRPGWCGVHVIQYQKPDPSKDSYSLEASLNDANENQIGSIGKVGPTISLTSKLPLTLEIKTGGVDADPVSFAYGSQSWDSNDKARCSVGSYDNGKREMDCGFTCD